MQADSGTKVPIKATSSVTCTSLVRQNIPLPLIEHFTISIMCSELLKRVFPCYWQNSDEIISTLNLTGMFPHCFVSSGELQLKGCSPPRGFQWFLCSQDFPGFDSTHEHKFSLSADCFRGDDCAALTCCAMQSLRPEDVVIMRRDVLRSPRRPLREQELSYSNYVYRCIEVDRCDLTCCPQNQ